MTVALGAGKCEGRVPQLREISTKVMQQEHGACSSATNFLYFFSYIFFFFRKMLHCPQPVGVLLAATVLTAHIIISYMKHE